MKFPTSLQLSNKRSSSIISSTQFPSASWIGVGRCWKCLNRITYISKDIKSLCNLINMQFFIFWINVKLTTSNKDCPPSDESILCDVKRNEIGWPLLRAFPAVTISGSILCTFWYKKLTMTQSAIWFDVQFPRSLKNSILSYLESPPMMSYSTKTTLHFIHYH